MGCSPAIKTCSLSGEVFVDGHPAEGVYVVFHKVDSMSNPSTDATASARTDDKGFYVTQAAQPGQYKVTLFWPRLIVGQEETIEGEDRFQSRYRDLQKPTMSIDVVPGENILPLIKLSSH